MFIFRIKANLQVLLILLFIFHISIHGQSPAAIELEKTVYSFNNVSKYDESQKAIHQFLNKEEITNEDRYYANVYLSYTYKRLFDYTSTLSYLDKALEYGIQTDKKDFFIANINCQKALSLFDIHRYQEADSLMDLLSQSNYQFLNDEYKSKIIMQEAYLHFLKKNYKTAEIRYDIALQLMHQSSPCDLPMIYAKKLELYGETGQKEETQINYQASLDCADSCGILKYSIYTKQMMVRALINQKEYLQALKVVAEMDSLNMIYNSTEHLKQIGELNKKYEVELKDLKINEQNILMKIQIGIILGLMTLLSLLYYFFSKSNRQKKIISGQNKMNERLVAVISHDIKEPLLGVQLLLKKLNIKDTYLTQASISLEKQVTAVNDILNNILKFQKVRGLKINEVSDRQDIINTILQTEKELELQILSKNIKLQIEIKELNAFQLPIAKEKLKIILYNLLVNAIKYSFPGGIIKIYTTTEGLIIQDYGVGIPEVYTKSQLPEIVNSEKGTENEHGTGIGLYIVGQLIKDDKIKIKFTRLEQGTIAMICT